MTGPVKRMTTFRYRPGQHLRGRCPSCPHTWKHHKHTGRCRPGCRCTNGSRR